MDCRAPGCGERLTSAVADALALSAQAGNRADFDTLSRAARPLMLAWIAGKWPRLPPFRLDDLMAEGDLVMVECVARFNGKRFLGYLKAAAFKGWRRALGSARRWNPLDGAGAIPPGLVADNRVRRAVGIDLSEEVEKILENLPKADADLLKMVYGIGVRANGERREPQRVKDLERIYGFGRNTLSQRIARSLTLLREPAIAAGLDTTYDKGDLL